MTAYYNENNDDAAAWLRTLIDEGHVAPGHVDTRSIVDVRPSDLEGFDQCHFFAGIGGWSLALRLAGWPDDRSVWTGSCPCQPFSLAGRRKGFADDRHLWPVFRNLIAERRPAKLFGEQVASAADWLRLVRSDLEALGYAVGAIPIEAASAGADHLRDRFWFVGHAGREGLAFRSIAEVERGDLRKEGPATAAPGTGSLTVADANEPERRFGDEQPSRQQPQPQSDPRARAGDVPDAAGEQVGSAGQSRQHAGVDVADASSDGAGRCAGSGAGSQGTADRQHWRASRSSFAPRVDGETDWAIGADGKARRVKSGVRLLVDGFPSRVGLLRGFGNAIDPRPAAKFIEAASG